MKTLKEKKQIFYNWLVDNGALFNYLEYIKFEWLDKVVVMRNYLRFRYIQSTNNLELFGWGFTKQGYYYWDKLDDKWRDYLKENNIE